MVAASSNQVHLKTKTRINFGSGWTLLKSHQRNLKKIQKELEIIRKFRNQIFHFESLQSFNTEEMKRLIFKFIYGISGVKIWEILKLTGK